MFDGYLEMLKLFLIIFDVFRFFLFDVLSIFFLFIIVELMCLFWYFVRFIFFFVVVEEDIFNFNFWNKEIY